MKKLILPLVLPLVIFSMVFLMPCVIYASGTLSIGQYVDPVVRERTSTHVYFKQDIGKKLYITNYFRNDYDYLTGDNHAFIESKLGFQFAKSLSISGGIEYNEWENQKANPVVGMDWSISW